jgi:Na+/phosphate symporter
MKEAIDASTTIIDFASFSHLHILVFVGLGVLLTVVLQTSAAVSVLALAALDG